MDLSRLKSRQVLCGPKAMRFRFLKNTGPISRPGDQVTLSAPAQADCRTSASTTSIVPASIVFMMMILPQHGFKVSTSSNDSCYDIVAGEMFLRTIKAKPKAQIVRHAPTG